MEVQPTKLKQLSVGWQLLNAGALPFTMWAASLCACLFEVPACAGCCSVYVPGWQTSLYWEHWFAQGVPLQTPLSLVSFLLNFMLWYYAQSDDCFLVPSAIFIYSLTLTVPVLDVVLSCWVCAIYVQDTSRDSVRAANSVGCPVQGERYTWRTRG